MSGAQSRADDEAPAKRTRKTSPFNAASQAFNVAARHLAEIAKREITLRDQLGNVVQERMKAEEAKRVALEKLTEIASK